MKEGIDGGAEAVKVDGIGSTVDPMKGIVEGSTEG